MAAGTAVGPVRRAAARPRRSMIPLIRWAATGPGSATGSSSRSWSRSCGSAAPMSRSPTAPARPPRSGTAATSGSRPGSSRELKQIARDAYDRIVGLVLEELAVDGCITKAPGGGECAGPQPGRPRQAGHEALPLVEGTASRWAACWPRRTGTTPRSWPPRWTNSMTSARCPMTSRSTLTPATTRRRPATSSPPADDRARSRTRATRHRSRPGSAGTSSGPTPGTTPSTGSSAATNATRTSSTHSSTSPTPSSPSVASSARHGPSTGGTPARHIDHDHTTYPRDLLLTHPLVSTVL